ncbi:peptidoglycan DD-metalloendopeptidase family protein [Oceanobacillus sp. FSL W7-1293]|uniref:aggregation-promoting factor C-terminal-like domain-containing protein n=1 Tax=Oceanobacillus sp. FSL W7-1293 TaxID=2921699 RepID=UPI0030CD25D7
MAELLKGLSIDLDLNTIKVDRGLKGVKDSVKTVNSEMKKNMSAFDRGDKSVEKYETRLSGLNKKLEVQKTVVKEAKNEYEKMVSEYGAGSKQAEKAAREYNNQAASLNNLERYVQRTKNELTNLKKEQAIADSNWTKAGNKLVDFGKKLGGVSTNLRDVGSQLTKKITTPAVAATSALGGITLVKGFDRLIGIDTAQAKLKGLGHDAEGVETIMESALDSVKGTSFGLGEAATTAANAVAAGVEPGKELTKYLSTTGDAAAIAGSSMGEMGSILNRVKTSNKAYNGELQQLSDRGLPVYQWLAEEAGVAAEEVTNLAAEGKISSEMLMSAIENNIGGAAQTMGQESFTAGIANMWAAVGRLGASFLDAGGKGGGFFSQLKPLIVDFTNNLDTMGDFAENAGVKFGEFFANVIEKGKALKATYDGLSPFLQDIVKKLALVGSVGAVSLGPLLVVLGTIGGFVSKVAIGFGVLKKAIGKIVGPAGGLRKWLGKLTKGFGSVGTKVGVLSRILGVLTGPIGWIITGITTLGSAFVIAYKKSDTFREGVNKIIDTVKSVFGYIKDFISGIKGLFHDDGQAGRDILASLGFSDKFIETVDFIALKLSHLRGFVTNFIDGIKGLFKDDGQGGRDLLSSIGVSDKMIAVLDGIALKLVIFRDNVQKAFGATVDFVKNAWSSLTSWFSSTGESMVEKATSIFGSIKTAVSAGIQTAVDFVKNLWGGLINWWNENGDRILAKAQSVFNAVRDNVSLAISAVVSYVKSIWSSLTDFWNQHGEMISQAAQNVWSFIQSFVLGAANIIWTGIKGFATGIYTAIKWALDNIAAGWAVVWPHIRDIATGVINAISSAVQFVFPYIVTIIKGAMNVISNIMTYVWPVIKFIVIETWNAIKGTIDGALKVITGLIQFFGALFTGNWSALWDSVKQILGGAVQFIWNFVQVSFFGRIIKGGVLFVKGFAGLFTTMWGGIRTLFSNVITWIVTFVRNMFTGMSNTIGSITQTIRNVVTTIWNAIWSFFSRIISTIVTFIRNRFTAMRETINSITTRIRELISLLWNNIYTFFQTIIRNIVDFVRNRFVSMRDSTSNIFTTIRDTAQRLWNAVKDKIWNPVKNVVKNVKDRFTTLKDNVSGIFSNMRDNVADWIGRMVKAVTDMPGKMASGLRTTASKIGDALASVGNTMLGTLGKGVNGVIAGINWVLDKLGISSKISEWKVPTVGAASSGSKMSMKGVPAGIAEYAHGTDGHPKDGPAWIGDGVGSNAGRELVRLPNGKEFLSPATPTLMPNMPKGTHVLSALDTKEYLKAPRYMFGTIGNGFKSAWNGIQAGASWTWDKTKQGANAVKDTALDVWSYVDDPSKLLNKALDALGVFPEKMVGAFKELPVKGFNKIKDGGIDFLKKKIDELFSSDGGFSGFSFPSPFRQSSGFGPRSSPGGIGSTNHKGIDFAAPTGTPIPAQAPGTVSFSGWSGGYGNLVKTRSGPFEYLYGHNSKNLVKQGNTVKKGQIIAEVGSTGNSTGPHVHFEIRKNGTAINPNSIVSGGSSGNLSKWIGAGMARAGVSGSSWRDGLSWIIGKESSGRPRAVGANTSTGTAKGLMQLKDFNYSGDPFDPVNNIFHGIKYIKGRYGSIGKALSWHRKNNWYGTGGRIGADGLYRLSEEGHPEYVIPTAPNRRTEAMKLLALAGKEISGNKRPHQLPNVSGIDNNRKDSDRAEEISLLRQQVELLTQLVLSSQNIEAKPVLTEGDIKRSYDKRDSRESAKHGIFTGRPGGAY